MDKHQKIESKLALKLDFLTIPFLILCLLKCLVHNEKTASIVNLIALLFYNSLILQLLLLQHICMYFSLYKDNAYYSKLIDQLAKK